MDNLVKGRRYFVTELDRIYLNQGRIKSAHADSHSSWSMTDKYFNATPEGRNEIFSGLKEFHRHYRAKFLGTQHCFNTSVFLSEHIYNDDNKMRTYVCVMPISKIIKLETLKDIVNEILPDEILIQIENYL